MSRNNNDHKGHKGTDKHHFIKNELYNIYGELDAMRSIISSLMGIRGTFIGQLNYRLDEIDKNVNNIHNQLTVLERGEVDELGKMLEDLNLENEMRNKKIIETND